VSQYFYNTLIILSLALWCLGFSYVPEKISLHERKQLTFSYGVFQPGNNWATSSHEVNRELPSTVYGTQIKVRYESYDLDFIDYRVGVDVQGIADKDLLFSAVSLAFELTNDLYNKKKHRIISVGTFAYSPRTVVIADDEQLEGISYKYGLSFEWVYAIFKTWSMKTTIGYNYQKLGEFDSTYFFDPSYMTIRGIEAGVGLNYVF